MLARHIIVVLLTLLSISGFSQTSLFGKWRRITANPHHKDTTYKQLAPGDLEINADTTFHIEGDSSEKNSTIPGWHVREEMNGTWELQNNKRLTLWLEPKESKMFLSFVIISLTQEELVLRLYMERNNKKGDIKYLRL